VTDRFHQPERSSAGDPRRVFIPAPSAPPGSAAGSGTGAPPRPRRPSAPPPGGGRGGTPPGGPGGPGDDPRQFRPQSPDERPSRPAPPRTPGTGRPWYRRLRWRRVLGITGILVVLALLGGFLYARSIFNRIEKVDLGDSLTPAANGTNYLIVGSDSRENVTEEGDAGFNGSEAPGGERSDTMMILHLDGKNTKMLSIPRDLYVPIADTGESQKINAAYNGGPTRLVDTITESLGIPIDRYVEVDFVSFAGLVDGLGGVTIDFPHPVTDTESGLFITEAGPQTLNGDQALAYVRSRHYTEIIDGEEVEDATADIGRQERQRQFLQVVFAELGNTKNPFSLASAASGLAGGLRIDDEMSMFDAIRLAWGMRSADPAPLVLPVSGDRNSSGAVLILNEEEAQPILDQVR
jgi:LCP family protein required for cell wall assembly